jgi:23S rRNA (cytosine1962-C5)-methyltransferase
MADLWEEARALLAARVKGPGFYRALFGYSPGEGFPRFHLDRFGDWWLATLHAPEFESPSLAELLRLFEATAPGVAIKFRNDEQKTPTFGRVVKGDPAAAEAVVIERPGYRFEARLTSSLDAGIYPDAEPLREEIQASVAGKRVLNLFAYTCCFGVVAARGGAKAVINVDASRRFLQWGQANYRLNGLRCDGRDFVAEDAHKFCRRSARDGKLFDVVIVDPPPFYSSSGRRRSSEEQLEQDLALAVGVATPGATIHFLQCSARVSAGELEERVSVALSGTGRPFSVEMRTHHPVELVGNELPPTFKEARVRLGGSA